MRELVGKGPMAHINDYDAFTHVLKRMNEMHQLKRRDYGSTRDPFANVRATEAVVGENRGWIGAVIRIADKVSRLQLAASRTIAGQQPLANEGIADSLLDLAVYAVIGLILFEEHNAPPAPVEAPKSHLSGVWDQKRVMEYLGLAGPDTDIDTSTPGGKAVWALRLAGAWEGKEAE